MKGVKLTSYAKNVRTNDEYKFNAISPLFSNLKLGLKPANYFFYLFIRIAVILL